MAMDEIVEYLKKYEGLAFTTVQISCALGMNWWTCQAQISKVRRHAFHKGFIGVFYVERKSNGFLRKIAFYYYESAQ